MSSVTYFCPCPNPLAGAFSDSDKQSDPHDVSTTSSDIGVDRDSSSGSTISAADSNTTTTTSALPSLKYPDNWVRQGGESGIYKVTIIVVMSLFIAAAVCCCIAIAVLWRRRRKRARQMARQRDLEKRRAVEDSDGEYDEMDEEGGSEAGCCERRLGGSKEERRRRRKAEPVRLAQRDGDVEDDEEHREKKRWARASARWKSHVRWIRRRRTGNKRILGSMMQRDAAASSVSVFSPSLHGNDTSVDAGDSLRDSSLARRRPVVGTHSEAHNQPSSSSFSSGSHTARSLMTSGTSTSPIDVSAVAVRTPSPSGQGGGNTQFAMRQQRDEQLPPSETDANTRNGARRAADLAPVNSIDPSGPQAHAVVHEYDSFPPPPANPRSGARRTVRASVDSACTYDHPPPNSPPLDFTTAQSLSASSTEATPATGNQNRSLGSDQDQSRNSDTENDDDLQQCPPAYRSRWRGSRSGNISEEGYEGDGYGEDDNSRRRARRNEKSASGSGYALYVPGTGRDGLNVLHVATDDKRVLARLTEAASAPPVSPMAPSFPPEPLSALPPTTTDSDHAHATAPAAPEWEDDVAFYDNLDSPGAGPSNSQSSFLPAPPKAVSSSLAFTSLIPPPPALEASSFAADLAFSTSGLSISGCVPGGSGGDAFIPMETRGPSNPPSSPSPWRPQQFSRYTFAEEELFGAEPEAGPSAPPFTDDAGEDTELEEASAPPLFEDEDAVGDEGLEGRTMTDSPVNRSPDGSANSAEERAIPPAAVR